VNKLHQMANVVVGLIVFALWLLILEIATTRFFVFLSSQLLVAVFMFGNTLKTIFEAIIFLFVMHPFDVGDRCEVDGMQVTTSILLSWLLSLLCTSNNCLTELAWPHTCSGTF
jgi:mechanosensitive ion channel protein 4/5/6/7/8/9/10